MALAYFGTFFVAAAISALKPSSTPTSSTPPAPAKAQVASTVPAPAKPSDTANTAPAVSDSNQGNTDSNASATGDHDLNWAEAKVLSEDNLRGILKDDQGVRYRAVSSYLVTSDDGRSVKVFCGEVNAHTSFGGYGGWSQFVASPGGAYTDEQVPADGWGQVWSHYCIGNTSGPDIWQ